MTSLRGLLEPQAKRHGGGPSGRRSLLLGAALSGVTLVCRAQGAGASWAVTGPEALAFRAAVDRFTAGAPVRDGRVRIEMPEVVENGNAVPVTVSVDSPMTQADHVSAIALFSSRNPSPEVAVFRLGARLGHARVATRMRLATSQEVMAVARMSDGSCWARRVDVLVTLAACVEA